MIIFIFTNMPSIASLNRRLSTLDYQQLITDSIEETKDDLAQYNRDDLSVGLLSTSQPIQPKYSPGYARKKGIITPNLFVTGAFYRGIFATVTPKTFTLNSSDDKSQKLELRYTRFIFGLTADSKSHYSLQKLKPVLFSKLKAATGL